MVQEHACWFVQRDFDVHLILTGVPQLENNRGSARGSRQRVNERKFRDEMSNNNTVVCEHGDCK